SSHRMANSCPTCWMSIGFIDPLSLAASIEEDWSMWPNSARRNLQLVFRRCGPVEGKSARKDRRTPKASPVQTPHLGAPALANSLYCVASISHRSPMDAPHTPCPHAPTHQLTQRGTYFLTAGTYLKLHHFRGAE